MIDIAELKTTPHRRFNPLTREWVVVSPHRTQRPWQGKTEALTPDNQPQFDPTCYLCPGNQRAGGVKNPVYESTYVFDNDYPALLPDAPDNTVDKAGLMVGRTERGLCRVGCFSSRHDLTIPRMSNVELLEVIEMWTSQYRQLGALDWVNHVQVFENRGAMMGASNPHPHCQIWANETLPNQPERELASQQEYRRTKKSCLLCDYLELEKNSRDRIVSENSAFIALVPFWAVWPFETLLLSKRHLGAMTELSQHEQMELADILKRLTTRYDNLFEISFPYSMGFHQKPTDNGDHTEWHFHAHYYPPLLRSATVQKFMVGYEMLGTPQRDITPESAAERLRNLPETHYRDRA